MANSVDRTRIRMTTYRGCEDRFPSRPIEQDLVARGVPASPISGKWMPWPDGALIRTGGQEDNWRSCFCPSIGEQKARTSGWARYLDIQREVKISYQKQIYK